MTDDLTRRQLLASTFGALALAALQACSSSSGSPASSSTTAARAATGTTVAGTTVPKTPLVLPTTSFAQLSRTNPGLLMANVFELVASKQGRSLLAGDGPVTLLAPFPDALDSAMASLLDKGALPLKTNQLMLLAQSHMVSGVLTAAELAAANGTALTTIAGPPIVVDSSGAAPTLGGAKIIEADLAFEGGVVHIIDKVLVPPELEVPSVTPAPPSGLADALAQIPETALVAAGFTAPALAGMIAMPDATLFAPADAAVLETIARLEANDAMPTDMGALIQTATRHVALGTFTADALAGLAGRTLPTIDGGGLSVEVSGDGVKVGGAKVLFSVQAAEGVVHVIDTVLLPGS